MNEIPVGHQGLKEEEIAMLEAFVRSPAYSAFKRLIDDAILTQYRLMEMSKDTHELYNLQGRINGMRYAQNAPVIVAKKVHENMKKKTEAKSKGLV